MLLHGHHRSEETRVVSIGKGIMVLHWIWLGPGGRIAASHSVWRGIAATARGISIPDLARYMKLSFQTRALLMADLTEHRRGIESQRAPQFRHPPGWTTHGFRTTLGGATFLLASGFPGLMTLQGLRILCCVGRLERAAVVRP